MPGGLCTYYSRHRNHDHQAVRHYESAEHAVHGTADQMSDATLTTKVKSALLSNERTRRYSIHVESDHGTVTIDGAVKSRAKAKYVASVVASVSGVRTVQNKLTWPTS